MVFGARTPLTFHSFFKVSAGLKFAMRQLFQVTVMRASVMQEAPNVVLSS